MVGEGTEYSELKDAVAAAKDGDTITLTGNATLPTTSFSAGKTLVIDGAGFTIDADQAYLNIAGNVTFRNCTVNFHGVPNGHWMYIYMASNGSLTFEDATVTIDGSEAADNTTAMYFPEPNTPPADFAANNTTLTIKNCRGNGISWGGSTSVRRNTLSFTNSNVTIQNCAEKNTNGGGGIIGTFDVTVTGGSLSVLGNKSYGSNGSNYTISGAVVTYNDNGTHGLSATDLVIKDGSRVSADNNGYYGVYANGAFLVDGTSSLTVTRNSSRYDCAGLKLTSGVTDGHVEKGATVTITDNYCSGLSNNGKVVFDEGSHLTITGNMNDKGTTSNGGGIYNSGASANLTIPSDTVIYNNHAKTAGDDIFNNTTSTITFPEVGSDWKLDGKGIGGIKDDCEDAIDGWYDDSADARWEAHAADWSKNHVELFDSSTTGVTGLTTLKAAHGLIPFDPGEENPNWDKSKSKTATNLNQDFESDVTLSLPSANQELVSDIVFVIDESSCSEPVKEEVASLLSNLYGRIEDTDATIKVGAVQFRGEVTKFPLAALSEKTKDDIAAFMGDRPDVAGSNMSAGLIAGEKMLDADTSVDADRKYLILVSDGITYIWDDENTDTQENYGINFANGDAPNTPMVAGPDGWDVKYGSKKYPDDWDVWLQSVSGSVDETIAGKKSDYDRDGSQADKPFVSYDEKDEYLSTVDVALYKSYQEYRQISGKYHTYAVTAGVEGEMADFPYGPSFMRWLANGEDVSFNSIEKDIYYLLDKGSSVTDVIGYGQYDDGSAYDFSFIDDAGRLKLTVGDETLSATKLDGSLPENATSGYTFGKKQEDGNYDYELYYYAKGQDGISDECFVWKINVPVSNFAPVQLTYGVRLNDPKTAEGTYGIYDADGDENNANLLTNVSATLHPVDTNGNEGNPEEFLKPTVSYKVSNPTPPTTPGQSDKTTPDIDVDKKLNGRELKAGEFKFKIEYTGTSSAVKPKVIYGTNSADGSVIFDDGFVFNDSGSFTFTVSEVLPADDDQTQAGVQHDGVTYDETTYTITANVEVEGNKYVVKSWSGDTDITFTNVAESDEPSNPGTEEPENPNTPSEPETPTGPDTPTSPETPENPETPTKPVKTEETLPSTGDIALGVVSAVAGVGIVCLGISFALKKRSE